MQTSTKTEQGHSRTRREYWLSPALGLILVATTIVAYRPVWHAGYIWDDDVYVTDNELLSAPDGLKRIWFSFDSPSQYFPLVYSTFRIEHALWGLNPAGYHWVNLLLHTANALLVWRLLARLKMPGAWLAAALFAVHPVQVESVAWITERKNVLSAFFFLLSLLAWVEFVEEGSGRMGKSYALAIVLYVLALLSKTTACTLPAALLLVLWFQEKPITRARLLQIVPFAAVGVGVGFFTMWWERYHQGAQGWLFGITPVERLLIASRAVWFYAGKLFWPTHLAFSYPRWTISASDLVCYAWLFAGGGFCAAIYWVRRVVGRSVEVAALFFVATLSPMLGFIMLSTFQYSFVADHYQYVASIGPLALVAAGITTALRSSARRRPLPEAAVCGSLLLLMGALTWRRSGIYTNAETLWRDTVAKNPNAWMPRQNLGNALLQVGKVSEAIEQYEQALRFMPDDAELRDHLRFFLQNLDIASEAVRQDEQALRFTPDDPETHFKLGNALFRSGKRAEGVARYQEALRLKPDWPMALSRLAWVHASDPNPSLRNGAEAVQLAQRLCEITGYTQADSLDVLAAAYAENGRFHDAVQTAQRAIERATAAGNGGLAGQIQERLKLYQVGRPYRTRPTSVP